MSEFFTSKDGNATATKNRLISGNVPIANPFEFTSNEFSVGNKSSRNTQNIVDQAIDSIR